MRSMRLFLVAGILATLILFSFVAVLQGFRSGLEEAETLFDNQLFDIAQLVANLDRSADVSEMALENGILFQIWERDELSLASPDAPMQRIPVLADGFGYVNFDSYRWRTYSLSDAAGNRVVIVAERTDLRFIIAENVVLETVVPILLGIPLAGLLIWSIVSIGLRPLKELSRELKGKQVHDLSPIHTENTRQELSQVVESLNGFIRRLDNALEREKRFSADAAHELRTPISVIKIQLHNLRQEIGAEHESFQQLHGAVERMQHLIEQLLSLYRTTPEEFSQNCRPIDLYQLLQERIASIYPEVERKQQALELDGSSIVVQGDRFGLETLVSNLLSNANKYAPERGNIQVSLQLSEGRPVISVEDDGPGIPEQDRERVFDRFYRSVQSDRPDSVPGCGLGLTIVAHIAELHHARILIEDSRFASGTAVRVIFGEAL